MLSWIRKLVGDVVGTMERDEVLTAASAVAFQVITAILPLTLLVLAIMGFLHLESAWSDHLGPQFKEQVSKPVYQVADSVVRRMLGREQGWWLSLGIVFTLWQVSGAARTLMGALSRIYNGGEHRPFRRRYLTSFALGTGVAAILLLAAAIARFGRDLVGLDEAGAPVDTLLFVVRWASVAALLFTAVWLLLRFGPANPGPHRWISFGAAVCVMAWIGTSLVFGFYATEIADYGSIFGSLATVFVLLTYLYLSSASFLIGAEVDAILRAEWRE